MNDRLHIAAVFATMNRAQTALSCVRALAAQTRPPERVIVADNVSSDDTVAALESMSGLPFQLIVHRMSANCGNAGGVRAAMELAFDTGADAVWILDDDSWPREEALAELLDKPWDTRVVRHAMQVDPKTGRFTWPLQVADGEGGWRLAGSHGEMPPGDFVKSRIIWTGALLPREVRDAVGPVNGELFIRGEDEEYPRRFEKAGFTQEAAVRSILDHPGPEAISRFHLLGKSLFYERGLADWKLYYKVRNMVWLKRGYSGGVSAMAMALAYAAASTCLEGPRRLPLIVKAAYDGWKGRLGKWSGQP
jgi:rhamnopyranosyl-N-acetylglucosaminyl-diphospho-decaprenol beta-1,3/1,4-galactofuranosyltransferase